MRTLLSANLLVPLPEDIFEEVGSETVEASVALKTAGITVSKATAYIKGTLEDAQLLKVKDCKTPHEIIAILDAEYDSKHSSRLYSTIHSLYSLRMSDGDNIRDHVLKVELLFAFRTSS